MKVPSGFSHLFLEKKTLKKKSEAFTRMQAYKIESAGVHCVLPKHTNDDAGNNRRG